MGNADTKLNFRKAVVQLTSKTQVRIMFVNAYAVLMIEFGALVLSMYFSPWRRTTTISGINSGRRQ